MGKFTFDISDDFVKQLGNLADVERIAPMMIQESLPIIQAKFKSVLSSHSDTGELVDSIKITKAGKTKNKYGKYFGLVAPTGYSKKQNGYLRKGKRGKVLRKNGKLAGSEKVDGGVRDKTRNMEKAIFLEYGTSKGQPARPFISKVINSTESQVLNKMQEVFNREVDK